MECICLDAQGDAQERHQGGAHHGGCALQPKVLLRWRGAESPAFFVDWAKMFGSVSTRLRLLALHARESRKNWYSSTKTWNIGSDLLLEIGKLVTRREWPEIDGAFFWTPGLDHSVSQNGTWKSVMLDVFMIFRLQVEMSDVSWRNIKNNIWAHVIQNRLEKLMPKIMFSYIPIKRLLRKPGIFLLRRYLYFWDWLFIFVKLTMSNAPRIFSRRSGVGWGGRRERPTDNTEPYW